MDCSVAAMYSSASAEIIAVVIAVWRDSLTAREFNRSVTMDEEIRQAQQPFRFVGGPCSDTGVLCLHGFTGSPAELRPLGQYLADLGYTVEGPLLPKHGGMPHELRGARWRDWVKAAYEALQTLSERCRRVFLIGLSMGGLITLHLAASECYRSACDGKRSPLRGIVTLSAPAAVNDPRTRLVRFARYIVPYHYPLKGLNFNDPQVREGVRKRFGKAGEQLDLDDPRTQKKIVESVRIPVGAIHELLELNKLVMRELPRITVPALLIQGRKDTLITPSSAEMIAARIGSADKRVIWYDNSDHVLPLEPDAPAMFEEIGAFIRAHCTN